MNRQDERRSTTNGVRIQTGTDGRDLDRAWWAGSVDGVQSRPRSSVGAASDSGVGRLVQRPDAKTLWQQRGKRGGPGAVRLPSPVSDGHSTTGAGHTGVQDAGPEETEDRGVKIRPYAIQTSCVAGIDPIGLCDQLARKFPRVSVISFPLSLRRMLLLILMRPSSELHFSLHRF